MSRSAKAFAEFLAERALSEQKLPVSSAASASAFFSVGKKSLTDPVAIVLVIESILHRMQVPRTRQGELRFIALELDLLIELGKNKLVGLRRAQPTVSTSAAKEDCRIGGGRLTAVARSPSTLAIR